MADLFIALTSTAPEAPELAHPDDAGYDISANIDDDRGFFTIPPWKSVIVGTGYAINWSLVPKDHQARVCGRSGLAFNHDVEPFRGTIDWGYTGELRVKLRNFSNTEYRIEHGDRIAQIVFTPKWALSTESGPERGTAGFGSTGS